MQIKVHHNRKISDRSYPSDVFIGPH